MPLIRYLCFFIFVSERLWSHLDFMGDVVQPMMGRLNAKASEHFLHNCVQRRVNVHFPEPAWNGQCVCIAQVGT